MSKKQEIAVHWFRRDLRLHDNHALFQALKSGIPVLPIFIFDSHILDKLEDKSDKRVDHLHRTLSEMNRELMAIGSSLCVLHGTPAEAWSKLIDTYTVKAVFTNHDHEQYGIERDEEIRLLLSAHGASFETYKDISIFERDEVVKDDGTAYKVFTPFSKKWKSLLQDSMLDGFPSEKLPDAFLKTTSLNFPSLGELGFEKTDVVIPSKEVQLDILKNYHETRDFPALNGTSKLSVHLRFGTISIRELTKLALTHNGTYLNELIWREFYMIILWHFPHAAQSAFRPQYDEISWEHNEEHFAAWCAGRTGYPMVDAGMRELNATGHMHNRVRMVVASFFTKHLLLDWRLGEAYFAQQLLDFELSSNNGGWQWASGSGCDAAPYFRVFNPELQLKKFDPNQEYVRYWLPEWGTESYPKPIVEHKMARKRAIDRYASVLKKSKDSTSGGQTVLF